MIAELLLLMGISLTLSLLLVPICRNVALRWNLVDVPDTTRKIHRHPIPRIGGLPVVLASFCSCLIVAAIWVCNGAGSQSGFGTAKTLAPAVALVFFVGLADDILGLKPWQKLAGQLVAAAIVVFAGVQIRNVAGFPLHPWLGAVVTVVWLAGCANAVNLIDGVDGLAAGIALLACTTTFVAALLSGNIELAVAVAPLAGALLGFLFFNFNRASIFLGDCGSLVLGFLLGCYGILWSEKSDTIVGMTAPLMALAVPLLDTTLAIARRFLCRQPIFGADRSHIHHRLLAQGLSARRVVLLLYIAAGIAGTLALFLSRVHRPWDAVIVGIFVCGAILCVKKLGYAEFSAVRRLMLSDSFRSTLNGQMAVRSFEEGLSTAGTPRDCWAAVESASRDFGFHHIEMQFAGHTFRWHNEVAPIRSWEIRIPISEEDWVKLSHEFGPAGHATAVVAFAETIRKVLMLRKFMSAREVEDDMAYSSLVRTN